MGFAVFRSSQAGREVPRDVCEESPQRRMPFEAFPSPAAASCHHDPCLLAVGPESPTAGTEIPRRPTPSAASRLCSTDEAVANALPLPAECCPLLPWASRSGTRSGPTRRSKEPRALAVRANPYQGFSVHPQANLGAGSHRRRWCRSTLPRQSRQATLRRAQSAERRADTEVPPVLEGEKISEELLSPRSVSNSMFEQTPKGSPLS